MIKPLDKISALSSYFIASVITTILNKAIVGLFDFKMHYFLILLQSASIMGILIAYYLFTGQKILFENMKKWHITSILLAIMIFSNMKTVYYFPVTLFTLYKNLSIIPIAFLECKFFDKKITGNALISFVLIIASSYTVHILDNVGLQGYLWVVANITSTAGYMLYLKKNMRDDRGSRIESVLFTNAYCIPIMAMLSFFFDPVDFMIHNRFLWILIGVSSMGAFLTAFSTAWTLQAVSSTALCMIGALNKVILSLSGFVLFKEPFSFLKLLSLFVGIFASGLYSYDSIKNLDPVPAALIVEEV